MININQKGKKGEREIASILNGLIMQGLKALNYPEGEIIAAARTVQRNQNQTAVGGDDLVNTMGLSIEVKRHENLSGINGWWAQAVASAARSTAKPVLLYRKNHAPWRCRTLGHLQMPHTAGMQIETVVDFDYIAFQSWFIEWTKDYFVHRAVG